MIRLARPYHSICVLGKVIIIGRIFQGELFIEKKKTGAICMVHNRTGIVSRIAPFSREISEKMPLHMCRARNDAILI